MPYSPAGQSKWGGAMKMFDREQFVRDCAAIREAAPLVHNVTNYVAMNMSANALLAIGASPLMSFCPDEMVDIVTACDALAINIGCLDSQLVKAAKIAAATAMPLWKPWVLDPVGVGASALRTKVAADLASNYMPQVIRCNASEAIALAAALGARTGKTAEFAETDAANETAPHGVDARHDSTEALESAVELSKLTGAVVSVSGAVDWITDGTRTASVANGSPMMPRVTAMGCTATAVTAAFLAVDQDPFIAALNAMVMMGLAGEQATEGCPGTGSLAVRFIDALSNFDAQTAVRNYRQSAD